MDTNHPCPSLVRLPRLRSSPAGKETPSAASSQPTERAVAAQQSTAISQRGGSVSFVFPALCLAPGASVGFVGCLRIRDLVANHFPHPRPFHSCPWDQRSSALEPSMGTVPARQTATKLHVRCREDVLCVSDSLAASSPQEEPQNHSSTSKALSKAQMGMLSLCVSEGEDGNAQFHLA